MDSDSWRAEGKTGPKGKEDMLLQAARAEQSAAACLSLGIGDGWGIGGRRKWILTGVFLTEEPVYRMPPFPQGANNS